MKCRSGFVSNSSSSSFVCNVCGESWSGWDGEYGGDVREITCGKCGYTMCSNCADLPDYIQKGSEECLKCQKFNGGECENFHEDDTDLDCPDSMTPGEFIDEDESAIPNCPICNLVTIPKNVLIKYLLDQIPLSRTAAENEIRTKFKNLAEFHEKVAE